MTQRTPTPSAVTQHAVAALSDLDAARTSNGAPSARNLIVTVFGDAVLPTGDAAALSVRALATLLSGFGVNERLVRTSLTRLVNDGLLASGRVGRHSSYQVAPTALATFRHGDHRIYRGERSQWDGAWTTVIADPDAAAPERAALRDELAWFGFRAFGPNVWVSPTVEPAEVEPILQAVAHRIDLSIFRAPAKTGSEWLAERAIDVDEVSVAYAAFAERFSAFTPSVVAGLSDEDAFKLRTLLVASFRRIVFIDPALPVDLLPSDWAEGVARRVAAAVYEAVAPRSATWFSTVTGIDAAVRPQRFEIGPHT